MTWKEIKTAVEKANITEDDEISIIQCENGNGDKTFHKMRLGRTIKLVEDVSSDIEEFSGCAV